MFPSLSSSLNVFNGADRSREKCFSTELSSFAWFYPCEEIDDMYDDDIVEFADEEFIIVKLKNYPDHLASSFEAFPVAIQAMGDIPGSG